MSQQVKTLEDEKAPAKGHESRKQQRVRSQQRNNCAVKYHRLLFGGVDGMVLSRLNRTEEAKEDASLTYGEIVHSSFLQLLDFTRKAAHVPPRSTFVDLGCGTGKAVVAAALSNLEFAKVWGIEILEPLASCAMGIVEKMKQELTLDPTDSELEVISTARAAEKNTLRPRDGRKVPELPSANEILRHIQKTLEKIDGHLMPCDAVVNSVCQKYGRKAYKSFIKEYKSFKKFAVHCDPYIRLLGNSLQLGLMLCAEQNGGDHEKFSAFSEGPLDRHVDKEIKLALHPLPKEIIITEGNIFKIDWWSEADVVYCASLLFSDEMIYDLFYKCLNMKPGAVLISLRPCPFPLSSLPGGSTDKQWELLSESFYRMTWQMAMVYVYRVTAATSTLVSDA